MGSGGEYLLEDRRADAASAAERSVRRSGQGLRGALRRGPATGTSHAVYPTPWEGDPRVNIQRGPDGKAKVYQVRQVLAAIDRLIKDEGEPVQDEKEGEDDG